MSTASQALLGQDPMLLAWRLASSRCQRQGPAFSKAKYKSGDYQVRVSGLHSRQSPTAGLGTARPATTRIGLPWGGEAEQCTSFIAVPGPAGGQKMPCHCSPHQKSLKPLWGAWESWQNFTFGRAGLEGEDSGQHRGLGPTC